MLLFLLKKMFLGLCITMYESLQYKSKTTTIRDHSITWTQHLYINNSKMEIKQLQGGKSTDIRKINHSVGPLHNFSLKTAG